MKRITRTLSATLRHKVTLEQPVRTGDGAGGFTTSWQTAATLWAAIYPTRGKEAFAQGKLATSAQCVFRVRYTQGIDAAMRFVHDGRIFNIRHIEHVGEQLHVMDITVEEGGA